MHSENACEIRLCCACFTKCRFLVGKEECEFPNKLYRKLEKKMDQIQLRENLLHTIELGLNAKSISEHTNISYDSLAKFRQGRVYLCPDDAKKLEVYLSMVQIPIGI